MKNAQIFSNPDVFNHKRYSFLFEISKPLTKTGILIPYRVSQMRPVEQRDNSCTLKAPDLAILELEI